MHLYLNKAIKYCTYQERSQKEVLLKLKSIGLNLNDSNEMLLYLIQNNFVNEERFANLYANSKFKHKKWGVLKITQGLKLKGISANLIKQVIQTIEYNSINNNVLTLIEKKDKTLKNETVLKRKLKITSYLLSKGYNYTEINKALLQYLEGFLS